MCASAVRRDVTRPANERARVILFRYANSALSGMRRSPPRVGGVPMQTRSAEVRNQRQFSVFPIRRIKGTLRCRRRACSRTMGAIDQSRRGYCGCAMGTRSDRLFVMKAHSPALSAAAHLGHGSRTPLRACGTASLW